MAPQKGSKQTQAPAFDYSALTPTEVAAPVRQSSVPATANPALPWVRTSWNGKRVASTQGGEQHYLGKGQQVIVPTPNATQVQTLIRKAAVTLGAELGERIGVAIQTEENPKVDGKVQRGMTAVRFAAKTGKKPFTRPKKSDTSETNK